MERAAHDPRRGASKKLKGLIMGITGAAPATRPPASRSYVTKGGIYASGVVPEVEDLFQRQARETGPKQREALLHQIQQILVDRVMHVPIYELAFLWGIGPRVEEGGDQHHQGLRVLRSARGPAAERQMTRGAPSQGER